MNTSELPIRVCAIMQRVTKKVPKFRYVAIIACKNFIGLKIMLLSSPIICNVQTSNLKKMEVAKILKLDHWYQIVSIDFLKIEQVFRL